MTDATTDAGAAADSQKQEGIFLKGQYIKDMSFESPRAPQSLLGLKEPPKIDIGVDLNAQRLQENIFELAIKISARAVSDNNTLFLVDLTYGGIFELNGIDESQLEETVLVHSAHILFPFARRVVADVTRDGGFPSLQMEPIDFAALYAQNKDKVVRGQQEAG